MSSAEEAKTAAAATTQALDPAAVLEQAIQATRPRGDADAQKARTYVEEFIRQAVKPARSSPRMPRRTSRRGSPRSTRSSRRR